VFSEEEKEKLSSLRRSLSKKGKPRRKKKNYQTLRKLSDDEYVGASPAQIRRLERQTFRAHPESALFVPGTTMSVQLRNKGCQHRSLIDVLACGRVPLRAFCTRCQRWSTILPETARIPLPNATRTVVDERTENRDGREYHVQVLATPRRARTRKENS
jgi:hypothetical protein